MSESVQRVALAAPTDGRTDELRTERTFQPSLTSVTRTRTYAEDLAPELTGNPDIAPDHGWEFDEDAWTWKP